MRVVYRIAVLALFIWPAAAGDVTLRIHITKRLTKKTIVPTVYNLRGTAPTEGPAGPDMVNELDRTVVTLSGKVPVPQDPQTVTIEQHNSQFEPDLAVIPMGSTVWFPNSDPIFHNVFSLSHAKTFDLGFYPKSKTKPVKFEHAGIVQVYCHIHANMYAAIVVTDSPWFGRPAADGTVTFKNVPAGKYRAAAWHKIAGLYQATVDVPASGGLQADIYVPLDVEHRP